MAFTVLAQLCGPKADETEMGATLFTNMVREGTLTLNFWPYLTMPRLVGLVSNERLADARFQCGTLLLGCRASMDETSREYS